MLTDDMCVCTRDHFGGTQRIYRLPNGYGISMVNSPDLHPYPFGWEAAMLKDVTSDGKFSDLDYTTPMTDNVEVFDNDDEANEFIRQCKEWAGEVK